LLDLASSLSAPTQFLSWQPSVPTRISSQTTLYLSLFKTNTSLYFSYLSWMWCE